jgi:Family of unknown function (DUF5675)
MNFILQRFSDNRQSTLGILIKIPVTGRPFFQAYTLEDEFRESKVSGETRIPAGKYEVVIQMNETPKTKQYRERYKWFKNHLMLNNVPGFTGIYIHVGNTDDDTDGCILLGDNADNNQIGPGSISNSTASFKRFYDEVFDWLDNGNKVFIEIKDESKLL